MKANAETSAAGNALVRSARRIAIDKKTNAASVAAKAAPQAKAAVESNGLPAPTSKPSRRKNRATKMRVGQRRGRMP